MELSFIISLAQKTQMRRRNAEVRCTGDDTTKKLPKG